MGDREDKTESITENDQKTYLRSNVFVFHSMACTENGRKKVERKTKIKIKEPNLSITPNKTVLSALNNDLYNIFK